MKTFKKSLKYFLIAILNLTVLTVLLAGWTDELQRTFHELVRPIEFLKIIGFTTLSLVGMRILVIYFRKKNIQDIKIKWKRAALLTFMISSYLYVNYTIKFVKNAIVNRQFRNQISSKIKPEHQLAYGSKAEHLTNKEYLEITKITWFPDLPVEASNIAYSYDYDGFLPDYSFTLTYDLPLEMKVDTLKYAKGDFSQSRTFEIIDGVKKMTYTEDEW